MTDETDNNPTFESTSTWVTYQKTLKVWTMVMLTRKVVALDPDLSDQNGVKLELYRKDSEKFELDPWCRQILVQGKQGLKLQILTDLSFINSCETILTL